MCTCAVCIVFCMDSEHILFLVFNFKAAFCIILSVCMCCQVYNKRYPCAGRHDVTVTKNAYSPMKAAVYSAQLKLKNNTCVQKYQILLIFNKINIILLSGTDVVAVITVFGPLCPPLLTAAMVKIYSDRGCSLLAVYILLLSLVPNTFTSLIISLPTSEYRRR